MKKLDKDIRALSGATRALNLSTSRRMLLANLKFLCDRYIDRPSRYLPKHLQKWNP